MKKFLSYVFSVVMVLSLLMYPNHKAYAANVSLGVSASTVNIGDNVTVSVTIPDSITATVDLSFSSDVLSFASASTDVGNNGGTVTINLGKMSMANSNSVSITFKAKTSGTASLNASVISAVDNNTVEDVALGGASTKITVANQTAGSGGGGGEATEQKSGDNSLASLKLSSATLSPGFKPNTTKYTATVDYSVSKVVVSAKTSNAKAVIESVTGDGTVDLKVGQNTIQVVVRAENGVKATYTIVVTRKAEADAPASSESESESTSEIQNPEVSEVLQWNGEQLQMATEIPSETVPADFEASGVVVKGQQMQALSFTRGDLKLLYLNNTNNAGSLYVYDEAQEVIYPFIKIASERSYVMVLLPNEELESVPEGFERCTFSIEGKGIVTAYQLKGVGVEEAVEEGAEVWNLFAPETYFAAEPQASEFFLLYCMNDAGEKGWYMYDAVEGTVQRYLASAFSVQTGGNVGESDDYAQLEEELKATKTTQYIIIGVAAAVIIILIIILVVLIIRNRSGEEDFFEEYEEEDEEELVDYEEISDYGEISDYEETAVDKCDEEEEKNETEPNDDSDDLEFIEFE